MNDEGKASKKNIVFLPNQTDQGFPFFPWKKQEIGPTWGRVLKTKLFPVTDHCKKKYPDQHPDRTRTTLE